MPSLASLTQLILIAGFALFGCVTTKKVTIPVPPTPEVAVPKFEKTFGEILIGKNASLVVRYKSMIVLINPDLDVAQSAELLPQTDYLLLSDARPIHFSPSVRAAARNKLKIITSATETDALKSEGFSEVKALNAGNRVMLRKNTDFLFVGAVTQKDTVTGRDSSSYLLEFDNGRNIFISAENTQADSLREFVYGLRDEGKEVYAGFFIRNTESMDAELAQTISLIQPKNTVILQSALESPQKFSSQQFHEHLKNELYDGPFLTAQSGEKIEF